MRRTRNARGAINRWVIAAGVVAIVGGGLGTAAATGSSPTTTTTTTTTMPSGNFPGKYYADFANGVPSSTSFFPIAVWLQDPVGGNIGGVSACSSATWQQACAFNQIGANLYLSLKSNSNDWPSTYGQDYANGEQYNLAAIHNPCAGTTGLTCPVNYLVAGGDPTGDTSAWSVASIASLLASQPSLAANFVGYSYQDEPVCYTNSVTGSGSTWTPWNATPSATGTNNANNALWTADGISGGSSTPNLANGVSDIHGFDKTDFSSSSATREVLTNFGASVAWEATGANTSGCDSAENAAMQSVDIASSDEYGELDPSHQNKPSGNLGGCTSNATANHVTISNYSTVANDCLWVDGMTAQNAESILGANTTPFWEFVNSGGDAFGFSSQNNVIQASVTSGSSTITATQSYNTNFVFTSAMNGMTVSGSGIPSNTTITETSSTTATMSHNATANETNESVSLGGLSAGGGTDCTDSVNTAGGGLCFAQGNQFVTPPAQVNSAAWAAIINGANGIEWFCQTDSGGASHNTTYYDWCVADPTVAANLTYIDSTIEGFASELNGPTQGICSMQNATNLTTSTSCSNGDLSVSTSNSAEPLMAMTKTCAGHTYLFVESDRDNGPWNTGPGSAFSTTGTYTVSGFSSAEMVYDSAQQYDSGNSQVGDTFSFSSGHFSAPIGTSANPYQVQVFELS